MSHGLETHLSFTQTVRGKVRLVLLAGVTTREVLTWLREGRCYEVTRPRTPTADDPAYAWRYLVRFDGHTPLGQKVEEPVARVLEWAEATTARQWR